MHFVIGANVDDSKSTGMGRQMHGLGDALQSAGHKVEYLFADALGSPKRRRLARLGAPFRAAASLRRIAKDSGTPPIAILHEPIAWATAVSSRRRIRTLAMVHACEASVWDTQLATRAMTGEQIGLSSRLLWPLTELTQTYASLRMSDGVLCLSSRDSAYLSEHVGVPRQRIARIDNGVEPEFLGLNLQSEPRGRDLLFLGSWLPRKGIKVLVEALRQLASEGVQPTLTLAGTGASDEEIRQQLPEPWRLQAEIIPHVSPNDLINVYRRHRILVLPSVAEGIPLVALEAMACGLCLIVTDVGGLPDVVDDGSTGWVVPMLNPTALATGLKRALDNPDEAQRLARNAYNKIQGYGWSRAADQVERFCVNLFGQDSERTS